MKKSAVRILCFLLLLGVALWKVNGILSFKFADGNTILEDFYRLEKNTVDVLTIGSSHAYVNFSPGTLWEEYGIASYDLGASLQPMWNSYYYLKEALKTQKPELLVLEGFGIVFGSDYSDEGRIIKNTYGLKWSPDRLAAIDVSVKDGSERDFLLDYARYHTRYRTLNRGDFFPEGEYLDSNDYWHYKDTMGQYLFDRANKVKVPDGNEGQQTDGPREKSEEYYRKTIELAQENGIPVVVIVAPYALYEGTRPGILAAGEIAEEYGVRFLDTNLLLEEIGLDFSKDFYDTSHMTVEGSRKFSLYVGNYLKENYAISDRRGDGRYAAWDRCAAYVEQYRKNASLKNASDLDTISGLLDNQNYRIFLSLDGNAGADVQEIGSFFAQLQIAADPLKTMWVKEGDALLWDAGPEEAEYYESTELHDICLRRAVETGEKYSNKILVDREQYQKVKNGLNVVVYDALSDSVADVFGIDADDSCRVVR